MRPSRGREIPENFNQHPNSSDLHRMDFANGQQQQHHVDHFCFLLVVISKRKHISRPSRHQNFSARVRTPAQQQIFSFSPIVKTFSFDLVRSLEKGTDSSHDFLIQSNCKFHSFYPPANTSTLEQPLIEFHVPFL